MEHAVQNAGAARVGQEFTLITDQPARRHMGDDAGLTGTGGLHLRQFPTPDSCDFFDHHARVIIVDVDGDFLDGFQPLTVLFPKQHLRARDAKLKPLAAHVLDQNTHLQFATARDLEGLAARRVGHADGDIRFRLFHQAFADHPALDLLAVTSGERTVVDPESDGDRRRIDGLRRQRFFNRQRPDGVGDGGLAHTRERHDVACDRLANLLHRETAKGLDLGHAELFDLLADAAERLNRRTRL